MTISASFCLARQISEIAGPRPDQLMHARPALPGRRRLPKSLAPIWVSPHCAFPHVLCYNQHGGVMPGVGPVATAHQRQPRRKSLS